MVSRRFSHLLFAVAMAQPVVSPPDGIQRDIPRDMPRFGPSSTPEDILRCERQIVYRGKKLSCDSPSAPDGEGLRMLVASTPEALEKLDLYQRNRRALKNTAYFGMAGLMVAALAPRFASTPSERTVWVGGGLALTLASFAYGKAKLGANELNLDATIETFNRAHPDDPIQLNRP